MLKAVQSHPVQGPLWLRNNNALKAHLNFLKKPRPRNITTSRYAQILRGYYNNIPPNNKKHGGSNKHRKTRKRRTTKRYHS